MKLLGIDYGAKRVGIASTDESGQFALPRMVLPNDEDLLKIVLQFINENNIEKVVIGESKNLDGTPNPILKDAVEFSKKLVNSGKEVDFHPEMYTSMEADRLQGYTHMRDASAASLILKSYIDRQNSS
ncbi:hypothetical protein BH11PAT3_BH11PAT3_0880 [soil metagenome]